jgi:hypothetical protein
MKVLRFIFILTPMLCGCPPLIDAPPHYHFDPEFRAWATFKPGTWWTYRELSSSLRDSLSVMSYNENEQGGRCFSPYYDVYTMEIYSFMDSTGTHIWHGMAASDSTNYGTVDEYELGTRLIILRPQIDSLNGSNISVNRLDSFQLSSGFVYQNVISCTLDSTTSNTSVSRLFYARNIGMIRQEMFNGEIWELVNFHIVQ